MVKPIWPNIKKQLIKISVFESYFYEIGNMFCIFKTNSISIFKFVKKDLNFSIFNFSTEIFELYRKFFYTAHPVRRYFKSSSYF